jgi:ATP-binding cassette subfamily F protein 3
MSFGGRVLFRDAAFQINSGERIGLIGPNGAGKSTLFSLILGDNKPDSGIIEFTPGTRLGYLPQESGETGDWTVLELATQVSDEVRELQLICRTTSVEEAAHHDAALRLVEIGLPSIEVKAKKILAGLAFRLTDYERPLKEMSGGWIMRAHLARLLVTGPDILMLDEPTNHLDLESLEWFQNHLKYYRGAVLVISHDRAFLNDIVDSIVEIGRGKVTRYTGNYDNFIAERAAREAQYEAAYRNQQREIAHMEDFVARFRAKNTKAAQAQDRLKRLEKMDRLEAPESAGPVVKFRFPQPPRSGHTVMKLIDVEQAYGERVIYRGLNLEVERGQRIVLIGPNGAGKSTLLKILAGVLPLNAGARTEGHNVTIGYFTQHRSAMLDLGKTVLEEALSTAPRTPEETVRTMLGAFLFRGDDVFKNVGVLSGGEKSRLSLVKILLNPPNLLLLDEPTTHLDIPAIDALVSALAQYEGTMVFISHDVHFIRATADRVLHVEAGHVRAYAGGYDYFREKVRTTTSDRQGIVASLVNGQPRESIKAPTEKPKLGLKEIKEQRRAEADARNAAAREKREREAELLGLEARVMELEARQREVALALQDPAVHEPGGSAVELNRKMRRIAQELAEANIRWEQLATAVAEP